jgi:hypothetical protein
MMHHGHEPAGGNFGEPAAFGESHATMDAGSFDSFTCCCSSASIRLSPRQLAAREEGVMLSELNNYDYG